MKALLPALAALALCGCAQQLLSASQSDCAAFGYSAGTPEFANCVQQRFNQREAAFTEAGRSMVQRQSAPATGFGTAYLRGQAVQGTSRICRYDRMGSPYVITVGAAQMCPISIP